MERGGREGGMEGKYVTEHVHMHSTHLHSLCPHLQSRPPTCSPAPHLQGVADGQAHQSCTDAEVDGVLVVALNDGKESGKEDDEIADKLEPNRQPPMDESMG